jgi:enoyl-CoA hydratase/carnithine racemase
MLTGERIEANQAEAYGLVNRVVKAASLLSETVDLAQKLAEGAPLAQRAILECVHAGLTRGETAGSELEQEKFAWLVTTEDAGMGFAAFVTKTQPEFKGK